MKICVLLAFFLLPVSISGAANTQSIATISTIDIDAVATDTTQVLGNQPIRYQVTVVRPAFGRLLRCGICCGGLVLAGYIGFLIYAVIQEG